MLLHHDGVYLQSTGIIYTHVNIIFHSMIYKFHFYDMSYDIYILIKLIHSFSDYSFLFLYPIFIYFYF